MILWQPTDQPGSLNSIIQTNLYCQRRIVKNKLYCSGLNMAFRRLLRKADPAFSERSGECDSKLKCCICRVLLETEVQLICYACSTCRSEGCGCTGVGVSHIYKFAWFVLVCFQRCWCMLITVGWASNCQRSQSVHEYMEQVPDLGWFHLNCSADNFSFFFAMVGSFFAFMFMGNVKRSVLTF